MREKRLTIKIHWGTLEKGRIEKELAILKQNVVTLLNEVNTGKRNAMPAEVKLVPIS